MIKHYYAAEHAYGIEFCNDYCTLYRFDSKAKRDAFVEDANYDESDRYGGYRTEAITRAEARRHFGNAFRLYDTHDVCDLRDWHVTARCYDMSQTYEYWMPYMF